MPENFRVLDRDAPTFAVFALVLFGGAEPALAVKNTGGEYSTPFAGLGAKGYDMVAYFTGRGRGQGRARPGGRSPAESPRVASRRDGVGSHIPTFPGLRLRTDGFIPNHEVQAGNTLEVIFIVGQQPEAVLHCLTRQPQVLDTGPHGFSRRADLRR